MKKLKYLLLSIILIIFILNINIVILSTKEACLIFFNKVFISVFPFIILSDILIHCDYHIFLKKIFGKPLSKLFNINPNSTIVIILSMLTGQPCNSIYIKDMLDNNQIDLNTANKLLCFTYFPSIGFVFGTIGIGIYNNIKIGLFLYLFTILNNILIGLYLRKIKIVNINNVTTIKDINILIVIKKSILKAINTCFIILGNLIIFNLIINLIDNYFNLNIFLKSILSSIIELTSSVNAISNIQDYKLKLIITTFALTFSSLSVLFQSFSILSDYKIDKKRIIIIKLLFSILTCLIVTMTNSRCWTIFNTLTSRI